MSFCLVCKRWRGLIRSAEFAQQYHSVKPIAFFHYPGDEGEETKAVFGFPEYKVQYLGEAHAGIRCRASLMLGYEGMVDLHLAKWRPGICIRCGENLYWAVEEVSQHSQWEDFFRILLKYDLKTGTWTVDEPILPYERLVNSEDIPNCLRQSLPYVRLVEDPDMYSLSDKVPLWNVHLAAHDGTMFVTLFDSLINEEAFSGQFSALIPEVKVIDAQLVLMISELPDVPETYLPTKAVAQNEMSYVTFE
ncbi:hypothetical protein R1sor_026618 [Riccia sorocarpa]|uniref:F-box domain-containing protein n=1 Tax=Riccia sorocarpa TaxID=122646 RepID=A0ABD3GF15_9MARC